MKDPRDRIREHSYEDPDTGCWIWQRGTHRQGYGYTSFKGTPVLAHRLAYLAFVGDIPEGMVLDHLCRRVACCNPDHLEPVTQIENVRRGESFAGRSKRKTHCPKGHPYSPQNTLLMDQGTTTARICATCYPERGRSLPLMADVMGESA